MKKSVIITIIAIYIVAIFLVANFGIDTTLDYETIYVEGIDGSNTSGYNEVLDKDAFGKIIIENEDAKIGMEIVLDFRTIPVNATSNKLKYTKINSDNELIEKTDGTAILKVNEFKTTYINITSQDTIEYNITIKVVFNVVNPDW